MIDKAKIYVKAGNGGCGCNSFKGVKFTRSYHSDGGGGGKGADVIIKADENIRTLEPLRYKQHFRAKNGKPGQGNRKRGQDAQPCIIKVPAGTIVRDLKNNLLLRELLESEEQFVVVKGGGGGKANIKTGQATPGMAGGEKLILLELKLIADIGIIGYPNAGKSALIAGATSAKPKTANYPFTTTSPLLAAVKFSDFEEPTHLTLVEIPALIKGAHMGKGLGAHFLSHAERTKVLIHLIDMSSHDGRDAFSDYENLNQELKFYGKELSSKPQIIVANKMDLPEAKGNLKKFSSKIRDKVYPISAIKGDGIKELLNCIRKSFRQGLCYEEKSAS